MVSEGAADRRSRTLRAELALTSLPGDAGPRERLRSLVEQALVFSRAMLVAVYAADGTARTLRLVESAGVPRALYGLREVYPVSGSLVAAAHRSGGSLWLTPEDLAATVQAEGVPADDFSLAVLPLGDARRTAGCLLAVTDGPDGFDADERRCLELFATAVTALSPSPNVPARAVTSVSPPLVTSHVPSQPAAPYVPPSSRRDISDAAALTVHNNGAPAHPADAQRNGDRRASSFSLAMDTGRIDVDEQVLDLFGLAPAEFDGKVETLLALTVPEDLPTLMSVVEADHMTIGDRELEFRIRQPSGEQRWLRLRGQLFSAGDGRPARLLGTVVDASDLRTQVNDVARVQRLAAVLATATTVREVSQAVVGALRAPMGADRMALAELEGDRLVVTVLEPPEPEAWPGVWRSEWRSEWPDAPVRAMPTLAAALREGRPAVWPAGTELEPPLAEVGRGGLAVLPLPAGDRMVGVCLIGWDTPHEFGADERALLTAVAGLAGQALMRVRAFDAEHELVGMLQRTLLPRRLPALPGGEAVARYLPATAGLEVGGDWYDVIPLHDNHVALVIGDVQGHNAGAATLMGQMRTALRAYAIEGHPPDVVVSHANRLLMGMETDLFATCAYVDVDMEDGTAWCVRAGHLPPVLRHPDGTTEVVEAEGGPPLGVITEADFPMTPLRLGPGTLLALTTDGMVESADLELDEGMRRLSGALSAADQDDLGLMADALLGNAHRGDDVALLLMRYDGMAVRPSRETWTVWRVPEAARHARRFTRRTLRKWAVTRETDTVLLVVSELVTNALVHTDGPVRLDLTRIEDRLRVAVADASPRTPVKPANVGWEATGGRGVLLVEALSAAWGTVPAGGGKQVWCEIEVG
ncbi:SpoIIE family protein phosphatase [Streptomyces jeddahensis]|uniref:SpoIIE family protein phosphatase n=1 Tax=Streptomyces jeddahensis TaxID=1716141 RepID=UPI001E582D78|nr:SpoIIE family protein phosphatase [Streptomyces jeddahensis]